jgi:hypothetical protein
MASTAQGALWTLISSVTTFVELADAELMDSVVNNFVSLADALHRGDVEDARRFAAHLAEIAKTDPAERRAVDLFLCAARIMIADTLADAWRDS